MKRYGRFHRSQKGGVLGAGMERVGDTSYGGIIWIFPSLFILLPEHQIRAFGEQIRVWGEDAVG